MKTNQLKLRHLKWYSVAAIITGGVLWIAFLLYTGIMLMAYSSPEFIVAYFMVTWVGIFGGIGCLCLVSILRLKQ